MDKDPFGYPLTDYVWVVTVAAVAGLIKHLNLVSARQFSIGRLIVDVLTAGFTGVMMFWFCESINVKGTMSALVIATGGLMGNRAWSELENFVRSRSFGGHGSTPPPNYSQGPGQNLNPNPTQAPIQEPPADPPNPAPTPAPSEEPQP